MCGCGAKRARAQRPAIQRSVASAASGELDTKTRRRSRTDTGSRRAVTCVAPCEVGEPPNPDRAPLMRKLPLALPLLEVRGRPSAGLFFSGVLIASKLILW